MPNTHIDNTTVWKRPCHKFHTGWVIFEKIDQKIIYLLCFFTFTRPNEWPPKIFLRKDAQKLKTVASTPYRPKSLCSGRADWNQNKISIYML